MIYSPCRYWKAHPLTGYIPSGFCKTRTCTCQNPHPWMRVRVLTGTGAGCLGKPQGSPWHSLTIHQEINLDFLEKIFKVLSFSRERGWRFQLLLCDKRSIASSSFCVWFNHVWVFRFVVYRSMWRFRFVCFGNRGFQVSKRIRLVSFSGVNAVISPCTTIVQGFRVSGIHQQELSECQAASLLLWLQWL